MAVGVEGRPDAEPVAVPPRVKKRATWLRATTALCTTFILPILVTLCWMHTGPSAGIAASLVTTLFYKALGVGLPLAAAFFGDLAGGDSDVLLISIAFFAFAYPAVSYALGLVKSPPKDWMMYSDYVAVACSVVGVFIVGGILQLLLTWHWRWIVPVRIGEVDEEFVWWKTARRVTGKSLLPGSTDKYQTSDIYYGDGKSRSRARPPKDRSVVPAVPEIELPNATFTSNGYRYPNATSTDDASIITRNNTNSNQSVNLALLYTKDSSLDLADDDQEGYLWGSTEFETVTNEQHETELDAYPTGTLETPKESLLTHRSTASSFRYPTTHATLPAPARPSKYPWYSLNSTTWPDLFWTLRYLISKLFIWSHLVVASFVMTIHMRSPESWRWFTCFAFPILVGLQKSVAALIVRGMPEDLYHVLRFESHFLASLLYRMLFFVVRTTWTFLFVIGVEITYKIFAIGVVHIPWIEKLRRHRFLACLFPAPEQDKERRKRNIEEGFFYLQASDVCSCLGVWVIRGVTGIPTKSPEGDMELKFNIMFIIQLAVELAILPVYFLFAKYVLKVEDFDPLTTGYAYLSRYQLQLCIFALAVYQINLGMLSMGL